MNLDFSDEHKLLRGSVDSWVSRRYDAGSARRFGRIRVRRKPADRRIRPRLAFSGAAASKSEAYRAGVAGDGGYFYRYELPKIGAWLRVVESREMTCAKMPEEGF